MTDSHSTHKPPTTSDRIRLYSSIGTNEALARLGDPDAGDARSSSATLELDSVTAGGPTTPARHRRMTVGVTVAVSNDGTCPPPPGAPLPPCPPYRPAPHPSNRRVWVVLALLILLLALLGLNQLGQTGNGSANGVYSGSSGATTTTTDTANSTPVVVPNSPIATRLDDSMMPGNSVIFNQMGELTCDGRYHSLNQVPEFAIRHTQNWVETTATQWQVRCFDNLSAAIVVALDANHNVINRQTYGANFQFQNQLTFVQSTDAGGFRTVQIDDYEPFNTFVGRTIYRFDSSNRISDAYRQDGFQRPLYASHITRNDKGEIISVTTEATARAGGARGTAYLKSEIEGSTRIYYDFDSFN